ncbi:class I SAM-dependent methyltransferase [Nonomuraea sp. NPDC059194]|uniref:class I SAM-dependent methyltransferase n=1 Tax=Nonomuraea sp. NPDC059194 TaxID=3346764 RepID=UPI00367F5167
MLKHAHAGGTIDHPRSYELLSSVAFLGRRREIFTRIGALSGARPGDRVLDVGCGTGYLSRILSPLIGPTGQVTGVDPSPQMIGYAMERAPGNCSYVVGEGQALDLPDASFDIVVSSLAVHHMPVDARGEAVREMARVLRPGGRLLIVEFRPPTGRLGDLVARFCARHGVVHRPEELLDELIPQAGFDIDARGTLPPLLYYVRAVLKPE